MILLISFALSFAPTPPEANLIFAACLLLGGREILLLSNGRLVREGNQLLTHRFHKQEIHDEN